MPKALLIAEKPSLMRTIQGVYNKHKSEIPYDVDFMAQAGHLLGLKMPDEIHPEYKKWEMGNYPMDLIYEYKVLPGKNDLYQSIAKAIKNGGYDFIIHAGDPDQEGELLVRLVLNRTKTKLPVKRFWSNDLTENAVLNALKNLRDDSEFDRLMDAALIRQHSDYSFGMNLTGCMTLKQGVLTRVGRVKAAIIRLLVDREEEIKNFVPHSDYKHAFIHKGYTFTGEKIYNMEESCRNSLAKTAEITEINEKNRKVKAPKLYKLSTAQTDAYQQFGLSGKTVLETAQSLYEKGLVSYPRTDCEYISEQENVIPIVENLGDLLKLPQNCLIDPNIVMKDKSYANNKAIADEGHTALIPTGKRPSGLNDTEEKIYFMILRRFVAIFGKPKVVHTIDAKAVDNIGEVYTVKAEEDLDIGYEAILNPGYKKKALPSTETLVKGNADPIEWMVKEIKAKCPARYTDGSLIAALEHPSAKLEGVVYKIGTPATRANIIEDVGKAGYYTKSGGKFTATEFAIRTVKNFKNLPLFDIEMTGLWERNLEQVRNGEIAADSVSKNMDNDLNSMIQSIKDCVIEWPQAGAKKNETMELLCPICQKPLHETEKAYGCSAWKEGCKFTIWKNFLGATITKEDVEQILQGNTIEKTLTSKAGNKWKQKLLFDKNNGKFEFV